MIEPQPIPLKQEQGVQPENGRRRVRFGPVLICLLLSIVTLAVFWPVTNCDFLTYDDPIYFADNAQVQSGLTHDGVLWAFSTGLMGNWNPTVWLSYMLDVELFGKGPAGPHFTNLALHAANAALVFLLLLTLTRARWRSLIVAGLFALHPFRVESVAWISERKDVLSAFFGLLSLLMYARYCQKSEAQSPSASVELRRDRKSKVFYGLALLFFALGLMSKSMLVTLPFIMLLLDCWPLQRLTIRNWRFISRRLVLEKIPFFMFGLIVGTITFTMHNKLGMLTPLTDSSISSRLANAFVACACYCGRTFRPVNMALPYPCTEHWPIAVVLLSGALVTVTCVAAVWLRRNQPYFFVGWFWFMGMMTPVSGIIQWGDQSMADRFTYLPSIGFFLVLTWATADLLLERQRLKMVVGGGTALVIGIFAACTRGQLAYWHNSETLFSHSLSVTENNFMAHQNLGNYFLEKGEVEKAISHFQKTLAITPGYAAAYNNLGNALLQKGQLEEAMDLFRHALQIQPNYPEALNNVGNVLLSQGRVEEAMQQFDKSLRLDSNRPEGWNNMGTALASQKRYTEAIPYFEMAARLRPDKSDTDINLGNALIEMGRADEAVIHLREALRQKPDHPKIHGDLARALAMQGKYDEAMEHYAEAIRLVPKDPSVHYNFGVILGIVGRTKEAIEQYQVALEYKPDYAEAHNNLGVALTFEGKENEAIAHYTEALRLKPDYAEAHNNFAYVLAKLGRRDEAIAHLTEALRLKPDYEQARKQLRDIGGQSPK